MGFMSSQKWMQTLCEVVLAFYYASVYTLYMCRCCGYHCGSQLTYKCVGGYPGNWVSESILAMAEVLGITRCLRLKNVYTILVAASAVIFRWNGEKGRSYHGRPTSKSLKPMWCFILPGWQRPGR